MNRRLGVILAVLAPVSLLGFSLYQSVGKAREAARRSQCLCHLKCIAVALHNYHSTFDSFPPGTIPNLNLPPERRLSWVVATWPQLSTLSEYRVELTKAWDDPLNLPPKLMPQPNVTYVNLSPEDDANWAACPDDPAYQAKVRPAPLTYIGIAGLGLDAPTLPAKHPRAGIFGYDRVTRIDDITDGTAATMMLAETTVGHKPWMAGGPSSIRGIDPATQPYMGQGRPIGGYHPGGANVAMADGSVRFVRETVDPKVLEALSTIAGGETIDEEFER